MFLRVLTTAHIFYRLQILLAMIKSPAVYAQGLTLGGRGQGGGGHVGNSGA